MSRSLRAATLVVLIGAWAISASVARADFGNKVVRWHGYTMLVPASWPVYDLGADPTVCVRFDRHAVYLGTPSAEQRCPAHAVGRTEAILVEPVAARGARAGSASAPGLPQMTSSTAQPAHGSSAALVLPARGLIVTATWAGEPNVIRRALGVRSLPRTRFPHTAGADRAALARAAGAAAHSAAINTGLGFDACSAPTAAQMSAWKSSPYHAVGIYIGGANMACAQPSLSAAWVHGESSAGWHLIPTYVGLQAPASSCGCSTITSSQAGAEGTAAAQDAVSRAQALGIGRGNPIYFDMEAYSRGSSTTSAVLTFLSAWTSSLHAAGYVSGVYSSASSGISDLVAKIGTTYKEPDDIWIADWNGTQAASDPYVPSGDWASHQRLHQYQGGHDATYGGVTLSIDSNYLDGATTGTSSPFPSSPFPDGTFVRASGSAAVYRIAGGAPLWVSNWEAVGGPQPVTSITPQQLASLPHVPAGGTFLVTSTGRIFRVAGGAAIAVTSWAVFGAVQPYVAIDEWDIDNVSNPAAHLNAAPADGTIVEGLPSQSYWSFTAGGRVPTEASAAAITVDDVGLAAFPELPPPTGGSPLASTPRCVVPQLRHMTIGHARRALRRAHCRLGKVHRPPHVGRNRVLHVTRQSPRSGTKHTASYAVNVKLG